LLPQPGVGAVDVEERRYRPYRWRSSREPLTTLTFLPARRVVMLALASR
jgi:hypothetical protein